ncbi:MAG: hypothetical protein QGI46_00475 [Planctomycetota bacterium]|nr:hypothetical protein [Planctomycetota bacterium]
MIAVACLALLLCPASGPSGEDLAADLASHDAGRARAAAAALIELGSAGHDRVWSGFAAAGLRERRARAQWVLERSEAASLAAACEHLDDDDREVRVLLVRFLGRVVTDSAGAERRARVLAERGVLEVSARVRAELLTAAGALGGAHAVAALEALIDAWPAPERARAAAELARLGAGREAVAERVRAAFSAPRSPERTPADVLAVLLEAYARGLAERPDPGVLAAERAPLILAFAHPAPEVRAAAEAALGVLVARLRELDHIGRAERLLGELAAEGLDAREAHYRRAAHSLQHGLDGGATLAAARDLGRIRLGEPILAARRWRWLAAYLEGIAHLAADRGPAAEEAFARGAELLDGLLAERSDLAGEAGVGAQHELLHERALLEAVRALAGLARGRTVTDPRLLEHAREAHRLALEAQVLAASSGEAEMRSLDVLFEGPLSPYRLLFARAPHDAWPAARCLTVQAGFGRLLAAVAPFELPGFEPPANLAAEISDPLVDPRRAKLMAALRPARLGKTLGELRRVQFELEAALGTGAGASTDLLEREARLVRAVQAQRRTVLVPLEQASAELRTPSRFALRLAGDLSEEGRTQESRALCERILADLEGDGLDQRYAWGIELAAQARITRGSAWSADDEGVRAEEELLHAVANLEGLERLSIEQGAPRAAAAVRAARTDALVSLAVNANVKLVDPERALGYFERAYALRSDDFMDVLLACYRARSGLADEARAVLAEVPHAPRLFYNLACTYALLGETERALEYLERELEENQSSRGARARQRAWARTDPDLVSIREDPRFKRLVGARDSAADR